MSNEQRLLVRSIEVRAVNGTAEIGYEHTPTFQVQRQTNSFHQMGKDNLWLFASPRCNIHGRSVHSVTSRGVPTIRPVHHPIGQIEVQIDWLGQTIEQHFDVVAVRGCLPLRDFQIGAKNAALSGVVIAFLRPIKLASVSVDGDTHAPFSRVLTGAGVALAGVNEGFDIGTIQIGPHHAHAFPIGPVELAIFLVELDLLGSKRATRRNDGREILPIDIGAIDGTIIRVGVSHVRPVDVSGFDVDN